MSRALWIALPLLLVANYFFAVARHEWSHAWVAMASGSLVVDVHIWPPKGWNLSWMTEITNPQRSLASLRLQGALPYLISLFMLLGGLFYLSGLSGAPRRSFLWLNVVLTAVIFPLADLVAGVGAYWLAENDFYYVFGPGTLLLRGVLSFWVLVLGGLAVWLVFRPPVAAHK